MMRQLILTVTILLSTTVMYGKEWMFEINPSDLRMYSSSILQRPKYYVDSLGVKNMVNLSFFTSKTYVGIYKDKVRSTYSSKKQWPFFVIKNGEAFIYDGKSWGQEFNLKLTGTDVEYIVSGYPILIQDSKKTKVSKSFFSRRRCPRTAIGIHPNGSVIIYVTTASTLKEVQTYLLTLGCTDAINLDGGSSTFLYLEGKKVYSSNQGRSYPNVLSW